MHTKQAVPNATNSLPTDTTHRVGNYSHKKQFSEEKSVMKTEYKKYNK
jgi:hypothetical protein